MAKNHNVLKFFVHAKVDRLAPTCLLVDPSIVREYRYNCRFFTNAAPAQQGATVLVSFGGFCLYRFKCPGLWSLYLSYRFTGTVTITCKDQRPGLVVGFAVCDCVLVPCATVCVLVPCECVISKQDNTEQRRSLKQAFPRGGGLPLAYLDVCAAVSRLPRVSFYRYPVP